MEEVKGRWNGKGKDSKESFGPETGMGGPPGSEDHNKCHGIHHLCWRKGGGGRLGARRLALPPPLVRAPFGSHYATDDIWANNGVLHCICYRVIRESGQSSR